MGFSDDEIRELTSIYPEAGSCDEAGTALILIPRLALPEGCSPPQVDALLCPTARDGYPSRLFLSELVTCNKRPNWNAMNVRIIERNWFAYSFKVPAQLRLTQLVAAHLEALV